MDLKFYKCNVCGNVAIKPFDHDTPLSCCGEEMEELVPNTVDAAVEKHVPVVTVHGERIHVEVGSTLHPMTAEHYITFICLITQKGYQFVPLHEPLTPIADFVCAGDEPIKVYEYCNLHGLWVAKV